MSDYNKHWKNDYVTVRRDDLEMVVTWYGDGQFVTPAEQAVLKRLERALQAQTPSVPPGGCHKLCDYPISGHSKDCKIERG